MAVPAALSATAERPQRHTQTTSKWEGLALGATTAISWTDATFNPWWGCERVSAGCQKCYAEAFAKRTGNIVWGKNADRRHFGDKHWAEPVRWNTKAESAGIPQRVFCASMADVFEDRRDLDADRTRLFALIEVTPWLHWQLLTKRPENVVSLIPAHWLGEWPLNCWMGTTVEDDQRAVERVPILRTIPAPIRFLSAEPLLGPLPSLDLTGIDWLIVGGESGPNARPMQEQWARDLADLCAHDVPCSCMEVGYYESHEADGSTTSCERCSNSGSVPVAFYLKQAGSVLGRVWGCADRAGSDIDGFPPGLRIRQYPLQP